MGVAHARPSDCERRRPPQIDRRAGEALDQLGLDRLALGKVGIPLLLGVQWRLLPQRREGYLAPTILDPLAPTPLRLKPCRLQCRIESIENCLLFFFADKLGVSPPPCPVIPLELGDRKSTRLNSSH